MSEVTTSGILERLHAEFGDDGIVLDGVETLDQFIIVPSTEVVPICEFLYNEPELFF